MDSFGCKKVYILDDHPVILAALSGVIISMEGFEIVGQATTVEVALDEMERLQPDLLITDFNLGGQDGFELIRAVKKRFTEVLVLVFTVDDETRIGADVLRCGADGILMKGASIVELRNAVGAVMEGRKWASQEVIGKLLNTQDLANLEELLSQREYQIFKMLGRGHEMRSIASELGISPKTVGAHCENIKRKTDIPTVAKLRIESHNHLKGLSEGRVE